jgi:cellulose biosynthesis protein BcsQ
MTRVYALTNHKGGVGKSTSATNIAFGLTGVLRQAGAPNARVLLIDTDSQGHATLVTTDRNDYGADDSLYTVLMADRQAAPQVLANCIVSSTWDENLHVLPAVCVQGVKQERLNVRARVRATERVAQHGKPSVPGVGNRTQAVAVGGRFRPR